MGCGDGLWGWAVRSGGGSCHSGGFLLRIMPPSWQLSPARSRKDHSLPPRRWCCRLAFLYRHDDGAAGGPFQTAATRVMQRFSSLGLKSRITARWRVVSGKSLQRFLSSPPKIQNRCTLEDVFRQIHAVIPKLTPSNQESLQRQGQNSGKPCSDS